MGSTSGSENRLVYSGVTAGAQSAKPQDPFPLNLFFQRPGSCLQQIRKRDDSENVAAVVNHRNAGQAGFRHTVGDNAQWLSRACYHGCSTCKGRESGVFGRFSCERRKRLHVRAR